jgi:hypothetical protein
MADVVQTPIFFLSSLQARHPDREIVPGNLCRLRREVDVGTDAFLCEELHEA